MQLFLRAGAVSFRLVPVACVADACIYNRSPFSDPEMSHFHVAVQYEDERCSIALPPAKAGLSPPFHANRCANPEGHHLILI
jgi:hypothetical protein